LVKRAAFSVGHVSVPSPRKRVPLLWGGLATAPQERP
jgi:hypothetical protein